MTTVLDRPSYINERGEVNVELPSCRLLSSLGIKSVHHPHIYIKETVQ